MYEVIAQLIVNGIIAGSIYALVALGLSLVYGILHFLNFAHGEMAMAGAYAFFFFFIIFQWPLWLSFILAIAAVAVLGMIIEKTTFKPVRNAPPLTSLITSIGVSLLLQSLALIAFGANIRTVRSGFIPKGREVLGVIITDTQILIIVVAVVLMLGLYFFLKYAKIGKAIRAVSDNKQVAAILGISPNKVIVTIFALGSALAAIAGILVAYEQNLEPTMGVMLGIKAFAAIILGGVGSIPGAVLGGYAIGLAENLGIGISIAGYAVPSGYKDAIAFIIMIIVLLFMPNGIMGTKAEEDVRKA